MKGILYTLILCCAINVAGATVYDNVKLVPNPKTADKTAFVSNPDKILSHETVATLNAGLHALEQETNAEIAVVAVNSIGAKDIEGFSNDLFNHWGIGKASKDNGVLLLFVLDQRKVRFEVGYGLEDVLPDAICKRIQMQKMIPEFKNGNYDAGILAGVQAAVSYIRKEEPADNAEIFVDDYSTNEKTNDSNIWQILLGTGVFYFVLVIIAFVPEWRLIRRIRKDASLKTNQQRYEAYTNLKRILSGGIGCGLPIVGCIGLFVLAFMFNGAGVLFTIPLIFSFLAAIPAYIYRKRLKQKLRHQAVYCPACGKKMRLLSESEDNKYLQSKEDLEDKLQSIDADVFRCDDCNENIIYRYDNAQSAFKECPQCGTKALGLSSTKTVTAATYTHSGLAIETYTCRFCNYQNKQNKTLPQLQRSSSGGGGFSSGGSSGGSFGGGSSGGGGSTSSW